MTDFGNIGIGKTYAEALEYLWPSLPDGVFACSYISSGYKMMSGVKNPTGYGCAWCINYTGSGRAIAINNNGTFSQITI